MRFIGALLLVCFGVFLLYAYNTGRLANVFHVLINPHTVTKSPFRIASETQQTGTIGSSCKNLLDLKCITSVFDTVSKLPDYTGYVPL